MGQRLSACSRSLPPEGAPRRDRRKASNNARAPDPALGGTLRESVTPPVIAFPHDVFMAPSDRPCPNCGSTAFVEGRCEPRDEARIGLVALGWTWPR